MNLLGILKGLIGAITAAFLTFTATPAVSPQIAQIASSTDAVVQEAVQQATTTSQSDVQAAYDLGQQVGRLKAQAEQIHSQPTTTMTTDTTGAAPSTVQPSPTEPVPASPAPTSAPAPAAAPAPSAPASQAHIDIISPIAGKGLNREYVHSDEIKDESNYMVIGAVVYDDNGQPTATSTVNITATDGTQDAIEVGTGDVATIWPDGNRTVVPVYTYSYDFKTIGDHTITFAANGITKSVTVTAK